MLVVVFEQWQESCERQPGRVVHDQRMEVEGGREGGAGVRQPQAQSHIQSHVSARLGHGVCLGRIQAYIVLVSGRLRID